MFCKHRVLLFSFCFLVLFAFVFREIQRVISISRCLCRYAMETIKSYAWSYQLILSWFPDSGRRQQISLMFFLINICRYGFLFVCAHARFLPLQRNGLITLKDFSFSFLIFFDNLLYTLTHTPRYTQRNYLSSYIDIDTKMLVRILATTNWKLKQ